MTRGVVPISLKEGLCCREFLEATPKTTPMVTPSIVSIMLKILCCVFENYSLSLKGEWKLPWVLIVAEEQMFTNSRLNQEKKCPVFLSISSFFLMLENLLLFLFHALIPFLSFTAALKILKSFIIGRIKMDLITWTNSKK